MTFVLCLLSLLSAPAAAEVEPGAVLTYRGDFTADQGDAALSRKNFELTLIVHAAPGDSADVFWLLSEEGRGGCQWPARFGRLHIGADGVSNGLTPQLLYERPAEQGRSPIPLPTLLLFREAPLELDQTWSREELTHRVAGKEPTAAGEAWRVEVSSPRGAKQKFLVADSVVLGVTETVFIGQGEKHTLSLKLADTRLLEQPALGQFAAAFEQLSALRGEICDTPQQHPLVWQPEQLKQLKDRLPAIVSASHETLLAPIAVAVVRDTNEQERRGDAVAALRKQLLDKPAPEFTFTGPGKETLDQTQLKDRVTVLHFWAYRDTPLEEPYGQVGYLDFLHRQRQAEGVQVFGVCVDSRLTDPATRDAAAASARKLKQFMNLSFPVLLDTQDAIQKFGDPRVTGARLPLFIVIDRQGRIVHYHAGHYEISRNQGLQELNAAVTAALADK